MNYFLYIILILILALYLYISYKYELIKESKKIVKESFSQQLNPDLIITKKQFMQPSNINVKSEWREIITEYIAEFNSVNLASRGVTSQHELINKYTELCLLPISQDNINAINTMLSTQLPQTNPLYSYIKKLIPQLRIIKCSEELEVGFPHTHRNIIVFSENYFTNPSISTFIHECIHIDQRLRPNKYTKLYADWGFVKYPVSDIKSNNFKEILSKSRNNPDGRDINWLWISPSNQAYWIGAVFTSQTPSSLATVENRIYKIDNINNGYNTNKKIGKYNGQSTLIHQNTEFVSVFGNLTNNNYHPNEISAELAVLIFETGSESEISSNPATTLLASNILGL